MEVGAAGDGDNRHHPFSALRAAHYLIHDVLPIFFASTPHVIFWRYFTLLVRLRAKWVISEITPFDRKSRTGKLGEGQRLFRHSRLRKIPSGPTPLLGHRRSPLTTGQRLLRRPGQLTRGGRVRRSNRSVWSGFRPDMSEGAMAAALHVGCSFNRLLPKQFHRVVPAPISTDTRPWGASGAGE